MSPTESLIKFLKTSGILRVDLDPELWSNAKELPILALARKGLINEAQALEAFRTHLGIDHIDLEDPGVASKLHIEQFAAKLNSRMVWKARILPLFDTGTEVVVAAVNPLDRESMSAVGFALSRPIKVLVADEAKLLPLLGRHFPQQSVEVSSEPEGTAGLDEVIDITDENKDLDNNNGGAAPIVKLANKIIADAVRLNASDIHLEPNEETLAVRFRVDGVLQDVIQIPKQIRRNLVLRFKILAGMDISEKRRPQDGRIRVAAGKQRVDMRVSSIPVASGEKLVLRLLRADYSQLSFKDLGMPPDVQTKVERAVRRQGKMILVSGPTGSGKTTTLYVALNFLNDGTTNITTIEDPIEYKFQNLNQIQVNNAANVNFASILRAVLRQDPDIIMIGEIRDGETLKVVLQAAQTGHLVLSTVHTNDAPSVVSRMLDLGGDPFALSTALAGVLAQRLTRRICEKCAGPVAPTATIEYRPYLEKYKIDPAALRVGRGCGECLYSGYKGQIGIFSYIDVNDEISELIYRHVSLETLVTAARKHGYAPIDEAAAELVRKGTTTIGEVLPYLNLETMPAPPPPAPEPAPPPAPAYTIPEVRIHVDSGGGVSAKAPTPAAVPSDQINSPRVLIVDDNKNVRKMLSTLLRNEMVVVDEAQNGREALQKVYEQLPALIICDVKMPEMDGKEFLEHIHHHKRTRDIPVIMLTVDDSEQSEIDLMKLGACEFLSKKSSPTVLVSRIRRVLHDIS